MFSWLKKLGQDILKGVSWVEKVGAKVLPFLTKDVAPVAETLLPMYAPLIAEGADILTAAAKYIAWLQSNVSAFMGSSTLDQRMSAITAFIQQGVQQWFSANFPGTAEVADKSKFQAGVALLGRGISDALASVSDVVKVVSGMSTAALGKDALTEIVKLVQWAEFTAPALLGDASKTGPQKFASIEAEVQSVLTDWLGTVSIADQTKFKLACSEIQQGAIDILNSLKPSTQTTQVVKVS